MKYRDPQTGEFKDIAVKVSDTLPVGTIVEYDGTTVPSGWELVDGSGTYKKIKKTETITATNGTIVDSLAGNSKTDAPSVRAVNNKFNEISTYSTEEKVIGTWIDGKTLYEKTIYINTGSTADTDVVVANLNIDNIEYLKIKDGSIFSNNNWWDVNFYYSNTIYAATYIRPEENAIKGKYGSYILGTGYITINYTKTTA